MQRINTTNKAVDLFGSGKHGFQSGVPASGVKATYLSELWCNATQEEQAALIEWVGLTLDTATTIPAQDNKQNLKALALVLQKQLMTSITTAGTAPTYTAAFTYVPAGNPITVTLTAGLRVRASIHVANNGAASTLNFAALGAKPIKQYDSTGALVDSVLFANQLVDLEYNGTVWVVLGAALYSASGAGEVTYFARTAAPVGYFKANGAAVSRTVYAPLFAAIGTTFGAGDGSTTFNLPDLRGEFVRGWDDGRGVDAGRVTGSVQLDQFQDHSHDTRGKLLGQAGGSVVVLDSSGAATGTGVSATSGRAGAETRPRNIALLACIKY